MKRLACYVRVSTEEQKKHGYSVESQIEALTQWAKDNNCEIVNFYNDAGLSASVSYKRRKALQDIIADCQRGKIDLIIFTKLDRFFRSVPDYYACMEQIGDIPWKAIWEDYETETSAGKFKVNIMLAIAQAESERTSERIKAVFEYQRSQGYYIGNPPIGYKKVNHQLVIDAETEPIVKEMFSTYLKTHSSLACERLLLKHNIARDKCNIRRALRNPAYAGEVQGIKCPAYITKEEHNQIVAILDDGKQVRTAKNEYLFNTLCKCEYCGKSMRARTYRHKYGENQYISYGYACDNNADKHRMYISERQLEKYLLTELDKIIGDYNIQVEAKKKNTARSDIAKRMMALEEKKKRVGIRFEDGNISEAEYRQKITDINKELSTLSLPEEDNKPIKLPSDWHDIYAQLDKTHKHQFWMLTIKKMVINKDKSITIIFF